MALWQIIDTKGGTLDPTWDDGLTFAPGEDGFTVDLVVEYAGAANFNYMGTPNWIPPESRGAPEGVDPEAL